MTKKELIMSTLEEKMGYCPEVDEDGDIRVAYQLKTIYVMTGDEDEQYVSVMLPFCVQVAAFRDVSLKLCPNAGISCSDFTVPHRVQTTDRLPFAVQVAATVFS